DQSRGDAMKKPQIGKWFETVKRAEFTAMLFSKEGESGASFVRVKADAPAWVLEAVRKAHQGVLPSDWVFAECQAAAEAIDGFDAEDGADGLEDWATGDWITEHTDGRVDVYTKVLFQWATDFCLSEVFADAEERAVDLTDPKG